MTTKTLSPVELELEGFRSFVKRTIIKFPSDETLLISGRWKDNPDLSSGSGKSTIPEAIAYVLGFCDRTGSSLKSWYSKKLFVRFRLTDGEHVYDVIRDPKLKIIEDGIPYEGLTKGADERLLEILHTPISLIAKLTYRPQRDRKGCFLNYTDSDKKEFLSVMLGMTEAEEGADSATKERDQIIQEIEVLNREITAMEGTLAIVAPAKDKLPEAKQMFEAAQTRYNAAAMNVAFPELTATVQQLSLEIQRSNQLVLQANTAKTNNGNIRNQIMQIEGQLEALQSQICPTCRREWDQGQALLDDLKTRKLNLLTQMQGNITVIKSAEPIQAAIPELQAKLQEANGKLGELRAPLDDAGKSMEAARLHLEQVTKQSNSYDQAVASITEKRARLPEATTRLNVANHTAAILSRSGFLSDIFEEVLRDIESRTNEMLALIPNVCQLALSISSTSTTQKGKVNKTITIKVVKDGEEKDIKDFSGGQQCSLEICTDLAVREAIRTRKGSPVGWLILDEAMDGLEVYDKRWMLEVIKHKVTGSIIVIDHSTEVKESFSSVLDIEYDGRESHVVQA